MEKTLKAPESSELYRKIDALELTPSARSQAIGALEIAERLNGVFYWLFEKLGQISGVRVPHAAGSPSTELKHQ